MKLDKYKDISSSGLDIYLKFFGDIPRIFVNYLNFLYVCQSASWLNFLLKLDKCKDISSFEWNIILKFFGDIPGMLVNWFQIILKLLFVCHSVSWLTPFLKSLWLEMNENLYESNGTSFGTFCST